MMCLDEIVKDKNILFITTKNIDYIRNTQEIKMLEARAKNVEIIYSEKKKYVFRIPDVWRKITKKNIKENDVIFVGFEPQFVIPFLSWKFKGKVVVIDFFISVYDTLICDRKKFKEKSIVAKLAHWMDRITIKRAAHVITDTKAHAKYFENEFYANPEMLETIYLEADSQIYYPRLANRDTDKFVVLYFGSILPLQGVNVVFDAIRELKDCDDIYFDIIGPVPDSYQKPIQDNVHYSEWLAQEELAMHIANADLCLAGHFNDTIDKAKRTIPGKAYIYMMMEKKFVLGDNDANHELFSENDNVRFVEMGSGIALSKVIMDERKNKRC